MGLLKMLGFGKNDNVEVVSEPVKKADDEPFRSGMVTSKTETSDAEESGGNVTNEQLYERHAWAYACIYQIASRIARLPAILIKHRDDPNKPIEPIDNPGATWMGQIISSPNDDTTWYDLIEATVSYLELTGNAFWEWGRPDGAISKITPSKVWDLRSDRVTINPGTDRRVESYVYMKDQDDEKKFKPWEVAHFRYFHPTNEQSGMATIGPASSSITIDMWAKGSMNDFFHNSAVPDGIITFTRELSKHAFKRFTSMFRNRHTGIGKTRRTLFIDGDAKYQTIQKTPDESGMTDVQKSMREETLAVFGVPPVAVGVLEHANFATAYQQMVEFYDGTLLPKIMKLYGVLNRELHKFKETELIDIIPDLTSVKHLMREHQVNMERREQGLKEVDAGALTVDEFRKEFLGKEPVPWGSEWWPPMNRMPASAVPTEPTAEGAGDGDDE